MCNISYMSFIFECDLAVITVNMLTTNEDAASWHSWVIMFIYTDISYIWMPLKPIPPPTKVVCNNYSEALQDTIITSKLLAHQEYAHVLSIWQPNLYFLICATYAFLVWQTCLLFLIYANKFNIMHTCVSIHKY